MRARISLLVTAILVLGLVGGGSPTFAAGAQAGPVEDLEALLVQLDDLDASLNVADSELGLDLAQNLIVGLLGSYCDPAPNAPIKSGEFTVSGSSTTYCPSRVFAVSAAARLQMKTAGVWKNIGNIATSAKQNSSNSGEATASTACKTGRKAYRTKGTGAYARTESSDVKVTPVYATVGVRIYCPAPAIAVPGSEPSPEPSPEP